MPTEPLVCPQCGGKVRPEEEDAFATCGFCGSRLYLDPELAVRHEILPAIVPRGELPGRLGRWLADLEALGSPENVSTRLLYFPFWVIPGDRRTRIEPAAALLLQDMQRFSLPAGDLKAFREELVGSAELIPATVLLANAVPRRPDEAAPALGDAAPKGTRLVHLPFWEVSFRIGRAEHHVWIDGAGGQVLPATVPASAGGSLDRTYSALLAAIFVVAVAGFLLVLSGGAGRVALGLAALAVGGPAGWWGIRRAIVLREKP